jgi:hypothetical protein
MKSHTKQLYNCTVSFTLRAHGSFKTEKIPEYLGQVVKGRYRLAVMPRILLIALPVVGPKPHLRDVLTEQRK